MYLRVYKFPPAADLSHVDREASSDLAEGREFLRLEERE